MTPRVTAIGILFAIVLAGTLLGLIAGSRRKMHLEEWAVAGRGLGLVLLWLLTAGEIYTTFAFLGASGWAYSRGGPALYILAYITLGYIVSFFVLPYLWEVGRKFSLQTQSDFFEYRYRSKYLAAAVSVVGFLFVIPYLEIQLTGLGIIVQSASFDAIDRSTAIAIGLLLVVVFVSVGGVRSVAWVSVLKDAAVVIAAVSIGLWVPHVYFG